MAVSAFQRTRVHAPRQVASLSPAALLLVLVAPAFDLLTLVLPGVALPALSALGCAGAGAVLLLVWLRYPRTSWLFAASLAAFASLALRLSGGAELAPVLSLLAVLALGIGGAFSSRVSSEPGALLS
jgi:hypothetical protein